MLASELTYKQFVELPEQVRIQAQEAYLVAHNSYDGVIDCLGWSWQDVKRVQDMMEDDLSYGDILEVVRCESKRISQTTKAVNVFRMFNEIKKQIELITAGEENKLSGELSPKERLAIEAVGGFAEFGSLPQTLTLCKLFNASIDRVNKMDYSTCFMALYYDAKCKQFDKLTLTQE